MRNMIRTKVIAVGCLLFGFTVAMAGGQAIEDAQFMNTGLFELPPGAEADQFLTSKRLTDDHGPGVPPEPLAMRR